MASVIKQAWRNARKEHHCYLCGHAIMPGEEYQDVTFGNGFKDGWSGLRWAKIDKYCCDYTMHPQSDVDFVVAAQPAEPIRFVAGCPF